MEFLGWDTCYYCGVPMTEADTENYEPVMCCSGHECGCMGLPTNPPYCIQCGTKEPNDKTT